MYEFEYVKNVFCRWVGTRCREEINNRWGLRYNVKYLNHAIGQ